MLSRRVAWAVVLVATLTMTVSYVDRVTLGALAPSVTADLEISEEAYGWLTAAFSFAYLIATPLAGWWIDRIGARRGLVMSVIVWSTVAALHAVVPTFGMLFALRIALGVAEGPGFVGGAQTVQRVLAPADRARGFGVLFTGSSIGAMIAPLLAGFLFDLAGWRVAFLGTAAIGLVWVPIWIAMTNRRDVRARLDLVSDLADDPVSSQPRAGLLELVRHPAMVRALIAIFAVAPTVGFAQAWGAKYLDRTFHVAQKNVGHYLWLPPLLLDAGAIAFGDLASRRRRISDSPPLLLAAIATLLAATLALLPLAESPWQAVAIDAIAMAGGGAIYTLVTADLLSRMPAGSVSLAGGIMAGAQSLALVIVNPLIGRAVDYYESYDYVAIVLGAWTVPGLVVWIVWRPRA